MPGLLDEGDHGLGAFRLVVLLETNGGREGLSNSRGCICIYNIHHENIFTTYVPMHKNGGLGHMTIRQDY